MTEFVAWLLESTALALLATAAIALVPSSLPAVRHRLWWLTLCVVLALPALDAWSNSVVWVAATSTAEVMAANTAFAAPNRVSIPADAVTTTGWMLPAPPDWVITVAVIVWALSALVALARLFREAAAAMQIAATAMPVSEALVERWKAVARAQAHGRRVRIVSADIHGACAIGIVTPSIVIGNALLEEMEEAEAETIVLHEYAHLLRYDDWTQLTQRVILAFVGFHPAVRSISRRIDVEREAACDQLAARQSRSPITCARALARAAEISLSRTELPIGVAPAASLDESGLQGRVTRLLADRTVKPWIASSVAIVEAAVILAAGTAVFNTQPVVDFQMSSAHHVNQPMASESSNVPQRSQPSVASPRAESLEPSQQIDARLASTPQRNLSSPAAPDTPEPVRHSSITAVSETVSADAAAQASGQKTVAERPVVGGPILAAQDPVAVRGAEHTEHSATLAQPVGSATRPDAVSPDMASGQSLIPKVSTPLEVTRLESASLDAVAASRWSQATERGADVGRSAAAAGQAIGRFFQRQGRAIARRF